MSKAASMENSFVMVYDSKYTIFTNNSVINYFPRTYFPLKPHMEWCL